MTAARDRRPRGLTEAIWEQTAELARLRASHAALLAACEMMLKGWAEWPDAELTREAERFGGDTVAVFAMRAAVALAKGES